MGTSSFLFTNISELLKTPPALRWLIPDYLLPESLALLFGDPAAGKSLLSLRWAVDLAIQGKLVVIIAGEGHFGLKRRLKALGLHLRQEEALSQAPLVISETGAALIDPESLKSVIESINDLVRSHGNPTLIIVDTLNRNLGPGDENSAKDMALFVKAADVLRIEFKATVLVVHHSGHNNKDRARGSSSLWGAVDTMMRLSEVGDNRVLEVTKMKDAPTPEPKGFTLQKVTLPWLTASGDQEESVVLEPTNSPVPMKKEKIPPGTRLAFQTLIAAIKAKGTVPGWRVKVNDALPSKVVSNEHWRAEFYARSSAPSDDAKKKAFQRARNVLTNNHTVSANGEFFWPTPEYGPWPELVAMMDPMNVVL